MTSRIVEPELQMTKTCAICMLTGSTGTRRFPANSRPKEQERWIRSLHWDERDSERVLKMWREQLNQLREVRWCERHFDKQTREPIDKRQLFSLSYLLSLTCR